MLSRLVIAFLPRSKRLLIFMAAVTICSDFGAPKSKVCHCFHCFHIYLPWSDGTGCHDLSFLNVECKPTFSLSSFTFIKRLFSSLLSAIKVVSSAYLRSYAMQWTETAMQGDRGSIPGSGRSFGEGIGYLLQYSLGSLVAQLVKNAGSGFSPWVGTIPWRRE